MKPGEYIQILEFFANKGSHFLLDYCVTKKLEITDSCKRFDEVRVLHKKYKKECEAYLLYPHLDLEKMNMLKLDIERICKEFGFRVIFLEKQQTEYKKGLQALYYYETTNITNLIVFFITRGKSFESSMLD